jgi:dTDP-4-dehydrorhamnose 3,5-epimerase
MQNAEQTCRMPGMQLIETALPGVLVLEPRVHRDNRGFFLEVYRADVLAALGIHARFVQDNHSRSLRGTLRGLHWQWRRPQDKLIRVVTGEIFDVAVDIRRGSPTFGRWTGETLSADNFRQMFIPAGFAHGFCVLSDVADVEYKSSAVYDPGGEAGLRWDDPSLAIGWPVVHPVLSVKDAGYPALADCPFLPALSAAGDLRWPAAND